MEIDENKLAEIVAAQINKTVEPLLDRIEKLTAEKDAGKNGDDAGNGSGDDAAKDFAKRLSAACEAYGKPDKLSGKQI